MDEARSILIGHLIEAINSLENYEIGTKEYDAVLDDVIQMYKTLSDSEKDQFAREHELEVNKLRLEFDKVEKSKDRKFKYAETFSKLIACAAGFAIGMNFEKTGTLVSGMFREFRRKIF